MRKLGLSSLMVLLTVFGFANVCFALVIGPLQTMINLAPAGSTVNVPAGIYNESVTIDKPLTVKGHSALDTFVNSPTVGQPGFIIIAPNVKLSGFTVRGGTNNLVAGIIVGGDSYGDPNDYLVSGVVVQKCTAEKGNIGIMVWRSGGTKILNNIVRYNEAQGIAVNSDGGGSFDILGTQVIGNYIHDTNYYGICVVGNGASLDGTKFTNNTLYNNGALDNTPPSNNNAAGFYFDSATGAITMTGNKIFHTTGNPLIVSGSVPGLTGTGNKVFPLMNPAKLTGTSVPQNLNFP
jgi:parallel beta-helix repeat protein